MNAFLRKFAEWCGRRKGAQIVVFDGAAEMERNASFLKGAVSGIVLTTVVLALTAPTNISPQLIQEIEKRESLVVDSNQRAEQAMQVADVCLSTAQNLERTLATYQSFLGSRPGDDGAAAPFSVAR
ncbi:MAG: hypothetical protein WD737_02575 [Gemmatimonadota bacterium]